MSRLLPCLLPATITALITCTAAAATPANDRQQLELTDIQQLELALHHGQVTLSTAGAAPQRLTVELEQRLKRGDPDRCLYRLQVEREGKHASFSAGPAKTFGLSNCSVERHYRIQLDPTALRQLTLRHHHALIELDALAVPKLALDFQHSQVTAAAISGEDISLTLQHGKGRFAALKGARLELDGQHANLDINQLTGQTGSGHWQHGRLRVSESRIEDLQLRSQHATTELGAHQGSQLRASSQHGPLRITGDLSQTAELRTEHGRLEYQGAVPRLTLSSEHGSSRLEQTLASAPFQIDGRGQHGNIEVIVPRDARYQYEVNSNRGRSAAGQAGGHDPALSRISLNVSHGKAEINPR